MVALPGASDTNSDADGDDDSVGAAGLIDGLSQVFAGQQTARLNQWPNSPFVIELGFMSCAFGLLGILSIWVRGTWRQATAVGYGVFLLLAATYHVYDAAAKRNYSAGNLGPAPWMDVSVGIILVSLAALTARTASEP